MTKRSLTPNDQNNIYQKKLFEGLDEGIGKKKKNYGNDLGFIHSENRTGLGTTTTKDHLEKQPLTEWKEEDEPLQFDKQIQWYRSEDIEEEKFLDFKKELENANGKLMEENLFREGKPITRLEEEPINCDKNLLIDLLKYKTMLDPIDKKKCFEARRRTNVYEDLGKSIFMNRAALKMFELDLKCSHNLTHSNLEENENKLKPFYFADFCAGPGGFSEYVLHRRSNSNSNHNWLTKGFGFTLKFPSYNDFRLEKFRAASTESFECFYGEDNSGNIFLEKNRESFIKFVERYSEKNYCQLCMADGGFDVSGFENIQEIMSKELYTCEMYLALSLLADEGNFVCKFFDVVTKYSNSLIFLMSLCFESICLFKPITSRPANTERFFIGRKYKRNSKLTQNIKIYLGDVCNKIEREYCSIRFKDDLCEKKDMSHIRVINELIKFECFPSAFNDYMRKHNDESNKFTILSLNKFLFGIKDTNFIDKRKYEMRDMAMKKWNMILDNSEIAKIQKNIGENLTNQMNLVKLTTIPIFREIEIFFEKLLKTNCKLFQNRKPENFNKNDFFYYPVYDGDYRLLIKLGDQKIMEKTLNKKSCWREFVNDYNKIELPRNSLILTKKTLITVTHKLKKRSGVQQPNVRCRRVYFILDIFVLGGINFYEIYNQFERSKAQKMLLNCLNKPSKFRKKRIPDNFETIGILPEFSKFNHKNITSKEIDPRNIPMLANYSDMEDCSDITCEKKVTEIRAMPKDSDVISSSSERTDFDIKTKMEYVYSNSLILPLEEK
ncbi:hypothetical protein SNEBB_000274 [Seison nebaliae]|nr:hypothetical protein SNEBB_000274 [Seison nebaliae]